MLIAVLCVEIGVILVLMGALSLVCRLHFHGVHGPRRACMHGPRGPPRYCGKLDAATVKAIVGDADDRDFVIFKVTVL